MESDQSTTIGQMKQRMAGFVTDRDWDQFHTPKNLAMGLAIETAELMEHVQWVGSESSRKIVDSENLMGEIRDELADCLSYVLALANTLDIDLSQAYFAKMIKNEQKYPATEYKGRYK